MNNIKKIGLLLLVLGVMTGLTQGAKEEKPDATIRLSGGGVAAGIGFSWGKGTLIYKGKDYPISVNGLSLGKVGITSATASGDVYHLKKLEDFDGNYTGVGAGMTLAGGRSAVTVKNQNGVRIRLISTNRGVDVSVAKGGVEMKLKEKD